MPTAILTSREPSTLARLPGKRVPLALAVALAAVGLVVGFQVARIFRGDGHTATAEVLTGTVTWSNEETRLVAFEADGVVRDPGDGDTIYSVIADGWQDVVGTIHTDDTYPTCLAGKKDDPVSMDRHRVELKILHWDTGGQQPQHLAVQVHCLD